MKVYFVSGLGADHRVFKNIQLPQGYEAIYLSWLSPFKNESLHDYARRLAEKIDTNDSFVLVGLSFGGMLATEMSRLISPHQTILISSINSSKQLPFYFRIGLIFKLYKAIPISTIGSVSLFRRFFTTETEEDKALLRQMIREMDPAFMHWALGAILTWKGEKSERLTAHIHGTRDHILPARYTNPTHMINRAGHLMVLNRAEEINEILRELLGS